MYHKLIAEFLGSVLLIFSVFASNGNYLIIGATLAIIVLLIGKITGAAVNPAIAFAFYNAGKITLNELFGYVLVEMIGGIVGYAIYNSSYWK